jgi:hypothetical protein
MDKYKSRKQMMTWLENRFDFVSTTEEFYGRPADPTRVRGIWLSGEDHTTYKGKVIYDYWSEDHEKRDLGVLRSFKEALTKYGYYSEWNDPGTVHIYPLHDNKKNNRVDL